MVQAEIILTSEIPKNIPEVLSPQQLRERSILEKDVIEISGGGVVAKTKPTGRLPLANGKVLSPYTEDKVSWGSINHPVEERDFVKLAQAQERQLRGGNVYENVYFVQSGPREVQPVRVVTSSALGSLFLSNLMLTNKQREAAGLEISEENPITLTHTPGMKHHYTKIGDKSMSTAVVTEFLESGEVNIRITGTEYFGEMKKGVFGALNFLLPEKGVLSMHCSKNVDLSGNVTDFFGMSGTGKTSLSSDSEHELVGDDEHGWSDEGSYSFEGGCYAKAIKLSKQYEPEIYSAAFNHLAVGENFDLDEDGQPIFSRGEENMRVAYSLEALSRVHQKRLVGHPKNIVFLTADAQGGMPVVAKLSPQQAVYQFLSGYTSKIPGTEAGVTSPEATFSACFGEPFLPRDILVYARLFEEYMGKHRPDIYLVNTGWQGGYSPEGRIPIDFSRACISAIQKGLLEDVPFQKDGLGFNVPEFVPGVPQDMLNSRNAFSTRDDYRRAARQLEREFKKNFTTKFAGRISEAIASAGPVAQVA